MELLTIGQKSKKKSFPRVTLMKKKPINIKSTKNGEKFTKELIDIFITK
jgi:hypothetical protein